MSGILAELSHRTAWCQKKEGCVL